MSSNEYYPIQEPLLPEVPSSEALSALDYIRSITSPQQPDEAEQVRRPLTPEQKRIMLRPEALAKLSMEEYMTLWQEGLNPHFLSHAICQGFRDHILLKAHTAGFGDFHAGLTGALHDDKTIRTPFYIRHLRDRDDSTLTAWLAKEILQAPTADYAHFKLRSFMSAYQDQSAVHFAAHEVADEFYGAETNNETFIVFPSDFVASQYPFACNASSPKSLTSNELFGNPWNDIWAWPPIDIQGIPVDAGIVFLPKDTAVDPATGSRYASRLENVAGQEKTTIVKDPALVDKFVEWATSPAASGLAEAYNAKPRSNEQEALIVTAKTQLSEWFAPETIQKMIAEFAAYDRINVQNLQRIAWAKPEQTVPAQMYWESYFMQHPDRRPKHLVYYSGEESQAISNFLREHNITYTPHAPEGHFLGFDDNHVTDKRYDPRARVGYHELLERCSAIIDSHYGLKAESHKPEQTRSVLRALIKFVRRKT